MIKIKASCSDRHEVSKIIKLLMPYMIDKRPKVAKSEDGKYKRVYICIDSEKIPKIKL